jgi:hypothetical protein
MSGFISYPFLQPVAAAGPVGGAALIDGETDAMGIDFTYDDDVTLQMEVMTGSVPVDSAPFTSLTYTSPSIKLTRQSDGVWRNTNHNLALQSQAFNDAGYTKTNITINSDVTTAPDGTSTADQMVETTANAGHNSDGPLLAPASSIYFVGLTYRQSIYLKSTGTRQYAQFGFSALPFGTTHYVNIDLNAGTIVAVAASITASSITALSNGWYLVVIEAVCAGGGVDSVPGFVGMITTSGAVRKENYTGSTSNSIYVWGWQFKKTPVQESTPTTGATGYIATTTAAKYDLPYEWDVSGVSQGILIEEQRTNLLLRSQEFDDTGFWVDEAVTTTANATTAPDGTTTADKIIPAATNVVHGKRKSQGWITTTNVPYTVSLFAKPAGYNWVEIQVPSDDSYTKFVAVSFNVSTGVVGTTRSSGYVVTASGITDAGNGWYRCFVTLTLDASSTNALRFYTAATDAFSAFWTGNGTDGAYFWGAQFEAGAFATSPIHTIGSTVTRAGDNISLLTSAYPHSDSAGSVVVSAMVNHTVGTAGANWDMLDLSNGSLNESHIFTLTGDVGGKAEVYSTDGGSNVADLIPSPAASANVAFKSGYAYAANDMAAVTNGGTPVTDASCTMPTCTQMNFGCRWTGTLNLGGYLKQVTYLKRRATNTELQTRTT